MTRALLALLLAAAPVAAQTTVSWGSTETLYTGGPKVVRAGITKGPGTNGVGAVLGGWPAGTVGAWDLGNTREVIKGGYTLDPGDDDHFSNVTAVPCGADANFQYPISAVVYFRLTSTTGDSCLVFIDGGAGPGLMGYVDSTNYAAAFADDGGTSAEAATTTSVTDSRWHRVIFVWKSTTSRSAYLDTDTTGATNTSSVPITFGASGTYLGRTASGTNEVTGQIAYTAILPVDLSDSADQRAAIFAGCDPVLVCGFSYGNLTRASDQAQGAVWKLDNDSGADAGPGNYDLTAQNTPVAGNFLLVARDLSGGGRHMMPVSAAPTYSSTQGNGMGGGAFAAASSQFLVVLSTPVPAAPMQAYVVGQSTASNSFFFTIQDKDVNDQDYWGLIHLSGLTVRWDSRDSVGLTNATTSSAGSASTNYLWWGSEVSGTSRLVERNGGAQGTNTTDRTPDNVDSMSIGMRRDLTPDLPLDGQSNLTILLNVSTTTDQARIERFTSAAYALGF